MEGIYHLQGTVKHYDWGGKNFIPSLLQLPNPGNLPFAEYWLGVHPLGVSTVVLPGQPSAPITGIVGQLSYLLKILDVHSMLSIQVHPTKKAAELAFEKENREGIPLDAPNRNYKDNNHKPELLVALGDFWLLHGFKPAQALVETLNQKPELKFLTEIFSNGNYKALYSYIMMMPQEEVNRILQPLVDRISREHLRHNEERNEDHWAAKAIEVFPGRDIDRGIFSIYLFNIVHLKKGEGIFQQAGVPHAYLMGQNVEIMANSDNVLRGGLTTKHIDVIELLRHVKCEATIPEILKSTGENTMNNYPVPVNDFTLEAIHLERDHEISLAARSNDILLLTSGSVVIGEEPGLILGTGHPAALLTQGKTVKIKAIAPSTLFRASGPLHNG